MVAGLLGVGLRAGRGSRALALEAAINRHCSEVSDPVTIGPEIDNIAVPDALAAYVVEAGRASDYDDLLLGDRAVAHD